MFRVLYELWPALIPVTLYVLWHFAVHAPSARRAGNEPRLLKEAPWLMLLFISALLAVASVAFVRLTQPEIKGEYTPAHMENGKLIEGGIQ